MPMHILTGARPGDLPIEFPTKLPLAVNLEDRESAGHRRSSAAGASPAPTR